MANRHLARSIVLQSLFEWDFGNKSYTDALEIFKRNIEEFAPGISSTSFMEELIENTLKKRSDLDSLITKAAPDWPIEKISIVDRNVLRIGLYELLFSDRDQVPPKVAINEAIELAKTFGGETSGRFVNGVLGAIYKEMGEPGKNDKGNQKKLSTHNEKLTIEDLGGALVYAVNDSQIQIALVHDVFGHWTLSKGKLEKDEDIKDGVMRAIKEEMGLEIEIEENIGANEYITYHPEKGKLKKRVNYFLAKSKFLPVKLGSSGGLDNTKWFALTEIDELNFYDDILPIVINGVKIIADKKL